MPIKDPKIEIDDDVAKIIGETICHEIVQSRIQNEKMYALAARCQRQYDQITRWQQEGKRCTEPWYGAADYFIPLTEWIVDAVWGRVMNTLFSQDPYMTAVGTEAKDQGKEDGITDFVDMALREIVKIYDSFSLFLKQTIVLPFTVCKYEWVQEAERMITQEQGIRMVNAEGDVKHILPTSEQIPEGYMPQGVEPVWAAEDKELCNSPKLEYIPFDDYVWSPSAKKGRPLYWEGNRFWQTADEITQKGKQKKFREDAVKKLKETIDTSDMTGSEILIAQREKLFECYHWYGRLPFNAQNKIDLKDPDAIEQEVHCVVDTKYKHLLYIGHWEYQRLPKPKRVFLHGMFEETEKFEGRSLVMKLYQTQKELNTVHNTIINNAMIAMQKIFVKKRTLTGEDWENPTVFPGAVWEEDQQGDIRTLEVGDVKAISWELEQSFINFAERISNISIYQTGTARQGGGDKTKGEVDATIYEGNIGMDKFIQRCHELLREICQWTVSYYNERMPPGLERRILGDGGQRIFPTAENMGMYKQQGVQPYWANEDLDGSFDFTWNGTTLNASKKWQIQVANDLEDRYLPQPMIQGNLLAVREILKRGLLARNVKDYDKILPPEEALKAEMERMQAEAEAQKAMDQREKAQPDQIVQKAMQQGVPREEAMKMIAGGGGA